MSVDIHIMPEINVINFPELLSGQRGGCFYFIVDTFGDLSAITITTLEKHMGSLALCRDTNKVWLWDGSTWVKA